MPVTWRIADVVVLESDEQATLEEWTAAFAAALADPTYQAGMGVVHDARRIGRVLSVTEARNRIDFVRLRIKQKGAFRYAIVVSSNVAEYGMGRMGETFAESVGVALRVFRDDLTGAIVWARGGQRLRSSD